MPHSQVESAARRVACIPELVGSVFRHLDPHEGKPVALDETEKRHCQVALSRLAQACHLFSDVALPLLWRRWDSFTPLIGLFHFMKCSDSYIVSGFLRQECSLNHVCDSWPTAVLVLDYGSASERTLYLCRKYAVKIQTGI